MISSSLIQPASTTLHVPVVVDTIIQCQPLCKEFATPCRHGPFHLVLNMTIVLTIERARTTMELGSGKCTQLRHVKVLSLRWGRYL